MVLLTPWALFQGAPPEVVERAKEEGDDELLDEGGNALEVGPTRLLSVGVGYQATLYTTELTGSDAQMAIISSSKRFIRSPSCQKVIEGIWSGRIIYSALNAHALIADVSVKDMRPHVIASSRPHSSLLTLRVHTSTHPRPQAAVQATRDLWVEESVAEADRARRITRRNRYRCTTPTKPLFSTTIGEASHSLPCGFLRDLTSGRSTDETLALTRMQTEGAQVPVLPRVLQLPHPLRTLCDGHGRDRGGSAQRQGDGFHHLCFM
jgi:hypothetical protein